MTTHTAPSYRGRQIPRSCNVNSNIQLQFSYNPLYALSIPSSIKFKVQRHEQTEREHPSKSKTSINSFSFFDSLRIKVGINQKVMAENTLTSPGITGAKVAEDVGDNGLSIKITEENIDQTEATSELLESQEKVKELEDELLRISGVLEESEFENMNLKGELLLSDKRHQEGAKIYEELGLNHKKMLEQISRTEERHYLEVTTLQESLQSEEEKNEELTIVKEAFDGLSLKLETSRMKMKTLKVDLQNSNDEAGRFEVLHRQSSLLAAVETEKALEFERLLELAKSSAIEMQNQMASLQDELKILYENITENQKLQEALRSTTAELSTVHGELELSKSLVQDTEKRLASKEAKINELMQEFKLARASESKAKEDIASLENLLSTTKINLQEKLSHFEDVKLKLKEEVTAKDKVEAHLRSLETKMKMLQEEIAKVNEEKEELEDAMTHLTNNTAQMKELCKDLEAKLQQSDENFCKADSLLSQALANSKQLEQKFKSIEELHAESGYAVGIANQKNQELEGMLRALNIAAEEAKLQLKESETRCMSAEQKNIELEQQLNLVEIKARDSQIELRKLSDNLSELNVTLVKELEEKARLDTQIQEFQFKVTAMESDFGKSMARNL